MTSTSEAKLRKGDSFYLALSVSWDACSWKLAMMREILGDMERPHAGIHTNIPAVIPGED